MLTLVLCCSSSLWRVMTICLVLAGAWGGDASSPSAVLLVSLLAPPLCSLRDGLVTVTVGGCSGLTAAGYSGLWGCGTWPVGLTLVPVMQYEPGCFAGKEKELY